MRLCPHPFQEFAGCPGLHLALVRASWDEAEELRRQLSQVHARLQEPGPLLVAVSQACPESAWGVTQRLVAGLADLTPERAAVVRLPLRALEWAERAAVARLWEEPPPALGPWPEPDLEALLTGLVQLLGQVRPGQVHELEGPSTPQLGELLAWFHAAWQERGAPPRWQPGPAWSPRPGVALITGAGGFLGRHLTVWLQGQGLEVHPAGRRELADRAAARALLERVRPERVFHLGAQSSVAASHSEQLSTLLGNVLSQRYLLEAMVGSGARVLVVGSSEEYGLPERLPLTEDAPLRPRSIYGLSKLGQDLMGRQFHHEYGLHVVRVRSFNHTGPGRGERFMESSFARQLAAIERGLQPPVLRVGNLESRRDFCDGRDAVRAYAMLLEQGQAGEVYQVCSGQSTSAREVLDHLLARCRVPVEVMTDPARLRSADIPETRGCPARLKACTGWAPEIALETSLADLLEDWRGKTGR